MSLILAYARRRVKRNYYFRSNQLELLFGN